MNARDYRFEDFTEAGYRRLLGLGAARYRWAFFGDGGDDAHIVLRHDVDISPQRALALARIENEESARSTYLWMLHSDFYNALERPVAQIIRAIAGLGHRIGLHFDLSFYDDIDTLAELERRLSHERALLADLAGAPVDVFSFHNPDTNRSLGFRQPTIGRMFNVYASDLAARYKYVSDSNGYWRFDDAFEVLGAGAFERLHILIHPEWWTPEPLSPRARIERALQGRKAVVARAYDETLARWSRTNVL